MENKLKIENNLPSLSYLFNALRLLGVSFGGVNSLSDLRRGRFYFLAFEMVNATFALKLLIAFVIYAIIFDPELLIGAFSNKPFLKWTMYLTITGIYVLVFIVRIFIAKKGPKILKILTEDLVTKLKSIPEMMNCDAKCKPFVQKIIIFINIELILILLLFIGYDVYVIFKPESAYLS